MALEDAETGMIEPEPHHTRRDLRSFAAAVTKGFDISPELLEKTTKVIGEVLESGKHREKILAVKAVNAMIQTNLNIERGGNGGDSNESSGVTVYIPSNNRDDVFIGVQGSGG